MMRKKHAVLTITIVMVTFMALAGAPAWAHFGTITPSDDIITQDDDRTLNVQVKFIHPMEQHYMEMVKPKQFGVVHDGKKTDLLEKLQAAKGKSPDQNQDFTYWTADYQIRRPGDYTFYVEPTPYWEPAEDLFIVHYTKVCVNAFGLEKGWDEPVGLETEIIPMTRPYGLDRQSVYRAGAAQRQAGALCRGGDRVPERISRQHQRGAASGGPLRHPSGQGRCQWGFQLCHAESRLVGFFSTERSRVETQA